MDRLTAHVIATAALTVTLATVPVLFADACHASSSALPPTATRAATHASSNPPAPAVAVLPALSAETQTQAAAAAPADALFAAPAAPGSAPAPARRHPGRGRVLLPDLPIHPCVDAHPAVRRFAGQHLPMCHIFYGYS